MSWVFPSVEVTDEVSGIGNTSRKSIKCATTTSITIATDLNVSDVIDGVVLASGDRVLVKNQASAIDNGIYIAGATPVRSDDYQTGDNVGGTILVIREGTLNADSMWLCNANFPSDVVGTNNLVYIQVSGANIGYVTGPVSSTINGIPRYSTTDGKFIANSGVLVDASNNVSGVGNLTATGTLGLTGNMTVTGTVDSVDVSQLKVNFDGTTTTKGDILVYNGSTIVRVPAGTNGNILVANSATSAGLAWQSPSSTDSGIVCTVIQDVKSVGTVGGDIIANTWTTRVLNTLTDTESGTTATPSNGGIFLDTATNSMIVPAGTYFVLISASCYRVEQNRARLQSIGDPEVSKVVTVADVSNSLSSKYFDFTTTTTLYRVWMNMGAAAPAAGGRTLLPVVITTNMTAEQVASAISSAIQLASAYASVSNNIVIIRNKLAGAVTDAVDGNTGFTITVLTQGNTTATTVATSLSAYAKDSAQASAIATVIVSQFTFTTTKVLQLQHLTAVSGPTGNTGLGRPSNLGGLNEIYSSVFIHRIKIGSS